MRGARWSKAASLYKFWNAQQQEQQQQQQQQQLRSSTASGNRNNPPSTTCQHEVITLSDSPILEHLNIASLSNAASPDVPNKKSLPAWAPLARHSTTSDPSPPPAPKYIPPPLRHISPASEEELQRAGFDPLEGSSIRYPANEYLRQYEIDIVKSCVAQNSAVCLPLAVSADHICAVVVLNFLRWFPRSRAVFCCNSLEAAQMFQERCVAIGTPPDEVFIVDTFQTFKKTATHKVGRVIVTTPQALEKIVESDSPVVCDFRCVVFCLDASEGLRITKYKNTVGLLTVKGIIFRIILVTPSVPSATRKLGPLRRRQQTITSLIISQWIEVPASCTSFRNGAVPLGLSVDYCPNVEVLSDTRSFTEKWLEKSVVYLERLNELIPLPSTKPQELFTVDWSYVTAKTNSASDDTVQLVVNCMFLVEAARNLIVHGPRVFYLYCVDLFGKAEKDTRAGNIALMILSDAVLSKVYEKIQTKYSYNSDSAFDISFSKVSLNSHPKFLRLKKLIAKCPAPLRCLVLCENEYVSRVVCESLDTPRIRSAIIRVSTLEGAPPGLRRYYRLPTQCSGIFSRPNTDGILVVNVDIPDFTSVVDTVCSNQLHMVVSMDRRSVCILEGHSGQHVAILDGDCEKLRPTDGRLINASDEVSCRRSSLFGRGGAIENYNFSYEFSRLQLPSSRMELQQYIPGSVRQKAAPIECARRHGFELTSHEFSEYCDRLAALPTIPRGFYSRNGRLAVMGAEFDTIDHPFIAIAGDVPCGKLAKRLEEYTRGGDFIKRRMKRQFEYKDDLVDKAAIEFYDEMIAKLNALLSL